MIFAQDSSFCTKIGFCAPKVTAGLICRNLNTPSTTNFDAQDYITSGSASGEQSPVWGGVRGRLSRLRTLPEEDAPTEAPLASPANVTPLSPANHVPIPTIANHTSEKTTNGSVTFATDYPIANSMN